jgi:hypothetical protein
MHEINLKFHKQECMSDTDLTVLKHSRLRRNSRKAGFKGPLICVSHPLPAPQGDEGNADLLFQSHEENSFTDSKPLT